MSAQPKPRRHLDWVWIGLMFATGFTWVLADLGATGPLAVAAILVMAGVKGAMVALDFMVLRGVRLFWRALVLGWLALVLGLIGLAYRVGLG